MCLSLSFTSLLFSQTDPSYSLIYKVSPLFLHFANLTNTYILGIVHPDGSCTLFDPQFSTLAGTTAPWDYGQHMVSTFIDSHRCSKYCRYLKLDALVKQPGPQPRPTRRKSAPAPAADATLEETPAQVAATISAEDSGCGV